MTRMRVWETRKASHAVKQAIGGGRQERELIARDYFFRLAGTSTGVIRAEAGTHRFFVATNDQIVGRETFREGLYDEESMRHVLSEAGVELCGRLVVEIGANIGTTTVSFVRDYGADVIAFEPDPENFKPLRHNLIENDIENRVQAHRMALSDRTGSVLFTRSSDNSGDHRVTSSPNGDTITVEAIALDSLNLDLSQVALVWIDVQSHEGRVLAGARSLLATKIPVVMEYLPVDLAV